MKISYNWLQEFIGSEKPATEIGQMLTGCGLEVEDLSTYYSIPGGLQGIVVGEVLSAEQHPNADKLKVCKVNIGLAEPKQIVCGAPNVAAGQKVLVATVGATVHPTTGEPFEIKKAKIRGELSEGMICAEDELSLGESHEGILVLPATYEVGKPAATYFETYTDQILEIGLTANRGDAASHYGVARDLKALGLNLNVSAVPELKLTNESPIAVMILPESGGLRYSGLLIKNVKIAASPNWLQHKLKAIGINPINNIVDITNYMLHAWGQPLHAFDASAISEEKIIVRKAIEGEKLITLDKVERTLKGFECVIADAQKPLALAGLFGGLHSGIQENTKDIFLESAWFDAATIRKAAKAHNLHTDAGFRFERGTDPNNTVPVLLRAAAMILEMAGGTIASNCIDVYPHPELNREVWFNPKKNNALIGKEIPEETLMQILARLEISITQKTDADWCLSIPPYRVDVTRPADVTEEILRIYGLNQIEMGHEIKSVMTFSESEKKRDIKERMCNWLSVQGFNEIASNSLSKSSYYTETQLEQSLKLLNPLSQDLDIMRLDFRFSMLEAIQFNNNRKNQDLRFFEVGKTYHRQGPSENLSSYEERKHLVMALYGKKFPASWNQPKSEFTFFSLKGIIERLLNNIGLANFQFTTDSDERFEQAFQITVKKQTIGTFGTLNRKDCKLFDIDKPLWYADLNLDSIIKLAVDYKFKLKSVPIYPAVRRDLSLELDKEISYLQLEKIALKTAPNLLKEVNAFDVYAGDKIAEGKKSYALSFILQDEEKTLTDQEIEAVMKKLIENFEKEVGAILRG
jgi:phenylalanyl-tRNA synthetase beta chain